MSNTNNDKLFSSNQAVGSLKATLKTSLTTLGLASLGAVAIVGAHHLGRRQSNKQARLNDYLEGVFRVISRQKRDTSVLTKSKNTIVKPICWISGVANLESQEFEVVGIDTDKNIVWQTPIPERVHDILIQPGLDSLNNLDSLDKQVCSDNINAGRHVAVMGRRPSEWFWVLNASSGEILHSIKAESNRHFYGHACYSLEGSLLYVTENNTDDFSGIIGVYDVATGYRKLQEYSTQGIGPHEIVMHPDGETLVIANGGIKTERASREELNIESMQPSLVYLNRHNGELLEQVYPEHNQMSVRHLAMHDNGTVVIGIQFQGERHISVPMVLTHKRGDDALTPLQLPCTDTKSWHRFHHYIASISVHSKDNLVCVTSPIGDCAAVFDLSTGLMLDTVELPDCAGVANWNTVFVENENAGHKVPSFIVSDGQGYLTSITVENSTGVTKLTVNKTYQPFAFDNHLNTIAG